MGDDKIQLEQETGSLGSFRWMDLYVRDKVGP